jgi:hypothetical protein
MILPRILFFPANSYPKRQNGFLCTNVELTIFTKKTPQSEVFFIKFPRNFKFCNYFVTFTQKDSLSDMAWMPADYN